jgi:hypothetical protein
VRRARKARGLKQTARLPKEMSGISASHPLPGRIPAQRILATLVATCLTLLALSAGAAARTSQPVATASSAVLHRALAARTADRRALAHDDGGLALCLRAASSHCNSQRHAITQARTKLAGTERLVKSLSGRIARRHRSSKITHTPPPSITGGSSGSTEGKGGATAGAVTPSGPGADSSTSGGGNTSGATGSSSDVTSAAGSGSTGALGSDSTEAGGEEIEGTSAPGSFEMGVVVGSAITWEMPFVQKLGAHTAREEFEIGTPASQMTSTIEASAEAGVKPLLLASFYGALPTPAQAQSLGAWAAQFGPGGSFWKGKNLPASSAVTSIEFGNETSYEYQYSSDTPAGYASRAQTYALRFKEAEEAIHAANPNVGLLAQGDPGNAPGTSWMDNMFKAVPNLGSLVAGWTVHPYGPGWQAIMDKVVSSAKADGAPSTIPLDVTEWGLSSDNGRCLDDNYGFNKCMTYSEAATTLTSNLAAMRARYGSRLASLYLFQARDQEETGASSSREGYFGALQSNEAPKGQYTSTVQSLLSLNP